MVSLHSFSGNATAVSFYSHWYGRGLQAFNRIFWLEDRGFYADWIDIKGNKRAYFYSLINLLVVAEGITLDAERSAIVMRSFDRRLTKLLKMYNRTRSDVWAPPSNLFPITNMKDFVTADFWNEFKLPRAFPGYENGGAFLYSMGFEVLRRFREFYATMGSHSWLGAAIAVGIDLRMADSRYVRVRSFK